MYRGNNLSCIYTHVHLDQSRVIYIAGIGYFYRNKLIRIATITISVFHFKNKLIRIATIAILAEMQRSGDKLIWIIYIERIITISIDTQWYVHKETANTVYPKKYAHDFCFAVLCCGYTLTGFPISIRFTSLALWQSNDCPSASKATLMNMNKYFMWIHYERLHNHNKAKHNRTVCIFLGIYCSNEHNATMQSDVQGIATNKYELHYIEFTKINEPQRNTVNHNVFDDYCHESLFLRLAPRMLSVSPWLSS